MSRKNINTRELILQSAWKLLESGSNGGARMSDIAKEAGISRQAVYLHFPSRAELLIATTRYLDEVKNIDERLRASRNSTNGIERLDAFIHAWGNYIPQIYGIAKALLAMRDNDEAARIAWADREQAVRHGCEAAIRALKKDGKLSPDLSVKKAIDILWTMLSVRNWEQLTIEAGWSQQQYIKMMKNITHKILLSNTENKK